MSRWPQLDPFLATDPDDAGCAETFELIDVYAELRCAAMARKRSTPGSRRIFGRGTHARRTSRGSFSLSAHSRSEPLSRSRR
jgi:hypothetical protein